jgi:predicted kinase
MSRAVLLVQMSGAPGCGKSTIARAIARRIGAVVLDHDVIKSALMDVGLPPGRGDPVADPEGLDGAAACAGGAAYDVAFALAAGHLRWGTSVVLDSPCYYQQLLWRGQQLATSAGATYQYIECVTTDLSEVARRLRSRDRSRSQCASLSPATGTISGLDGEKLFRAWMAGMRRPSRGYLRVDTTQPLQSSVAVVLGFLGRAG